MSSPLGWGLLELGWGNMGELLSREAEQAIGVVAEGTCPQEERAAGPEGLGVPKVLHTAGQPRFKLAPVAQTSIDYARRAIHLNKGDESEAVNLLVQWCHTQFGVLDAFIPRDELQKRVKRVVRKAKEEQSR